MSDTLKFILKGSRDYVHGTSLFSAFVEAAGQHGLSAGKISVSFKQMIHNPVCVMDAREANSDDAAVARLTGQSGQELCLCINAAHYTDEVKRQEFDETRVCENAVIGDMNIVQDRPHHQDLIELLVSLCKRMHQECIDSSKKWVFSRYDGEFPIPAPEKVELKISKQVGTKLTCSDVLINGKKIGDMYFS